MPTISDSNAKILQEYIPKLLTYIKKYAVADIGDKPRTVGYKQVNFYHPNYINDHQIILGIVLTLIENLSISNKGFSLLLGDLYIFAGHLWVRSCEIELEKCQQKSHSELKRYIAMSLLSVGSSFEKAHTFYRSYIDEAFGSSILILETSTSSEPFLGWSLTIKPLISIFSYKDNQKLLDDLLTYGFYSGYYFDEYGIETRELTETTRRFMYNDITMKIKELEQTLNEGNIQQGLIKFYYQNNHFQKKQFRQIVGWIIIIALVLCYIWF